MTLRLYYIRFIIASNKFTLNMRTLLGKYFFINRDFSLFMPQIHKAQDMLLNSPIVIIHFFTLGSKWLNSHIVSLNTNLQQQSINNPLGYQQKNYNINVQLSMQLLVKDQLLYKIPAKYQFNSILKYFTVQFYAIVASLKAINQNP